MTEWNRFDPVELQRLYDEVTIDPLTIGYDPKRTRSITGRINNPDRNPEAHEFNEPFTPRLALDEVIPRDLNLRNYGTAPDYDDGPRDWLMLIMSRPLDEDLSHIRGRFLNSLPDGSQSKTNIQNRKKALSRAEVLWEPETVIVEEDWFMARRYVEDGIDPTGPRGQGRPGRQGGPRA